LLKRQSAKKDKLWIMKTIVRKIVGVTVLFVALSAVAETEINSENTSPAVLIPWSQVPLSGTFWVAGPNGLMPPLPGRPQYMAGASVYSVGNDQFVVDAQNVQNFAQVSLSPPPLPSGSTNPAGNSPAAKLLLITSNAWFNQIVISNHTFVSLGATVLDGIDGSVRTSQLPAGALFPIATTNLTTPLSRWVPVGVTNSIQNTTFEIPYNPALKPISFYSVCAQTNGEPLVIPPYTLLLTNFGLQTDQGVTVSWRNSQPGNADEFDVIVENDTNGHSYLVGTTTTTGASNSFSFELTVATNLQFVNYALPAPITADQFFLSTSNFNEADVVTIPYVANTNSGRVIMEVAVYDVTDPNNAQLLGEVDGTNCNQGTLEIPGVSIQPGVDVFEFRVTDDAFSETDTDITITNSRMVSIVSPFLALESNGTNRIAASSGGYGVALKAVTEATNGTWDIKQFNPDGTLYNEVTATIADVGQTVIFDDNSTPDTDFPVPYYDLEVSVIPTAQPHLQNDPPAPTQTKTIRVWLLPRRSNTGSITAYDDTLLPSNNGDKQFVLSVMQNGESEMSDFVCYPVDIQDGNYVVGNNAVAVDLNQRYGWTALQAMLSGSSYHHFDIGSSTWSYPQIDRPINFVAVDAHGVVITEDADSAYGLQGPPGFADNQVTQFSLRDFHFDKRTNAVAIAIFTGCRIGNGPFMHFILRNKGLWGQISSSTATAQHIRPCFGLGWTSDTFGGADLDQWYWMSYFTLFSTELGGSGSSPFAYSLDAAVGQANFYYPAGSDGVLWSGVQGMTLDQAAQ
jgi:hypothetical protein